MCVVVAVIVWLLDLLPVVSSDPVHGEVYSIQHYVIKCVSELRHVGDFLRVFRFPPPINRTWIVSRVIYILIVNLTLLLTYLVWYCTVRPYIPSAILPSFYQKFIVQPFRQPAIIQIWKPGQSYFKDRPSALHKATFI